MYFGGRLGGHGESPRCFIQVPIWADLNSVHVLQNDGLMWTQTGAMPGSFTLTYGRSRVLAPFAVDRSAAPLQSWGTRGVSPAGTLEP